MRLAGPTLAALAVLAAFAAFPAADAAPPPTTAPDLDWPQFRGPARDGRSAETGLLARWPEGGPPLLWSVDGIGRGFSHVAVAAGHVYVTGLTGREGLLSAFTLDGAPRWQAKYGREWSSSHAGARSIPTVHDGRVYITSGTGTVACFAASDGQPVWSVNVAEQYQMTLPRYGWAESLLIDGDNVICTPCGRKAAMVALDRRTGKQVWASPPLDHKSSYCSPLPVERGGTRMIVTLTDRAVVAFSPADGALIWQHPYSNSNGNHPDTPIHLDGLLYVTSGYGKGAIGLRLADDGRSVRQLWQQPRQDPAHGHAVLVDGHAYASSHRTSSGLWSCVEVKTGRLAWEARGVGRGGSVVLADGLLYCYAEDATVGLVRPDAQRCQVVSSFKVTAGDGPHWAHPVISNGRLFIRHGDALMCYDVRDPSRRSPPAPQSSALAPTAAE